VLLAEFINALANQEVTYKADELNFRRFTSKITGLDERKEKLVLPLEGEDDKKGGADKKGAKKKK
jgi:hypothetical protein